jgi:hypothetical protein
MRRKGRADLGFRCTTGAFASLVVVIVCAIAVVLVMDAWTSIQKFGLAFWYTSVWNPVTGEFGALPFIWGTLYSSVLALLIATPISLGIAVFISELAPEWLQQPLVFLTELLAAIPSIVYGLWGVFVLVPAVRWAEGSLPDRVRELPFFAGPPLGLGLLSAALILAIMVIPVHRIGCARAAQDRSRGATRRRLRARGHAVRGDSRGVVLRAVRHHCGNHAGIRSGAWRNHGGDDGDRKQPASVAVDVCAALHDGRGDRQRVRGSLR